MGWGPGWVAVGKCLGWAMGLRIGRGIWAMTGGMRGWGHVTMGIRVTGYGLRDTITGLRDTGYGIRDRRLEMYVPTLVQLFPFSGLTLFLSFFPQVLTDFWLWAYTPPLRAKQKLERGHNPTPHSSGY